MSTELVTAHAGQNHVDSADIGELYAGAFGSGRYALDVGERMSVSMTDANTLHIGTGGFIFDGRWVRVTGSGEDIKIANGGQGMFRKDVVAYAYSRDPSSGNIESGSWVVVQGEPASTETAAAAPAIDEGSILNGDLKATCAVAEVDVAGLTPTAKLLLPCVASLKAVGDSVSQYTTKTFTSAEQVVKYGASAALDTSVKIDGYTPVCITEVRSNHTGSCIVTQFGLRSNGTAFAGVQNNEVTNRGTWRDLKITLTVLYKKDVA